MLARVARAVIRSRTDLDASERELVEKLTTIALAVVALFVAIDLAGIDTAALSIFSGTLGVGLGFGLQKVVSNFVSGMVLLWDRSVKPGDTIVIDATEAAGEVTKVGTRAVSVLTRDGKVHLIPNETLMTQQVENWGYEQRRVRLRMAISVAIGSDYDLRLPRAAVLDRRSGPRPGQCAQCHVSQHPRQVHRARGHHLDARGGARRVSQRLACQPCDPGPFWRPSLWPRP